jgi:pimeloyl-ACP methyl ester carboxylesterase
LFPIMALGAEFIVHNVFVDRPEQNPYVRWFAESSMRDEPGYPNFYEFTRVCETLAADVANHDFSAELAGLALPVLALYGDHDKLTCQGSVLKAVGRIPRVRTVILRRCGHMPMIERPHETLFHLDRFLRTPP